MLYKPEHQNHKGYKFDTEDQKKKDNIYIAHFQDISHWKLDLTYYDSRFDKEWHLYKLFQIWHM